MDVKAGIAVMAVLLMMGGAVGCGDDNGDAENGGEEQELTAEGWISMEVEGEIEVSFEGDLIFEHVGTTMVESHHEFWFEDEERNYTGVVKYALDGPGEIRTGSQEVTALGTEARMVLFDRTGEDSLQYVGETGALMIDQIDEDHRVEGSFDYEAAYSPDEAGEEEEWTISVSEGEFEVQFNRDWSEE